MFFCCECCVLSGRGLCGELITLPEESYRLCCVVVCDLETSRMRRPWPALGRGATAKKKKESRLWVSPFQFSNHSRDFHETWHKSYDIRGHVDAVYFSFLQSVIAWLKNTCL
jgi:hypothetical protein